MGFAYLLPRNRKIFVRICIDGILFQFLERAHLSDRPVKNSVGRLLLDLLGDLLTPIHRNMTVMAVAAGLMCITLMLIGELSIATALVSILFLIVVLGALFLIAPDSRGAIGVGKLGAPRPELTNREFREVLVRSLPEPTIFVAHDGRVECANDAARTSFNFIGQQPILSAVVRRPEVLDAVEEARRSRVAQRFAFVERGEMDRHYASVATPVRTNAGMGVLITMHDETEVKRAERARADFLANASHELRTPLTSLAGFIETMRGPAKDDREAWDRFLEIMQGQAERMRRLINDLLSLSRIELGEHHRPDTDADLAVVVGEVGDALGPVADDKDVSIFIEGPESDVVVRGVRDELSQVAQNLIDNAIKYSEPGDVVKVEVFANLSREDAIQRAGQRLEDAARMSIASSVTRPGTRYAALRVEDAGPGIDRKFLPRLAERFYRVDPGRGLRRGTGLGLAIVKHIVAHHRGDFLVESVLGRGTAFAVLFPLPDRTTNENDPDTTLVNDEKSSVHAQTG